MLEESLLGIPKPPKKNLNLRARPSWKAENTGPKTLEPNLREKPVANEQKPTIKQ